MKINITIKAQRVFLFRERMTGTRQGAKPKDDRFVILIDCYKWEDVAGDFNEVLYVIELTVYERPAKYHLRWDASDIVSDATIRRMRTYSWYTDSGAIRDAMAEFDSEYMRLCRLHKVDPRPAIVTKEN